MDIEQLKLILATVNGTTQAGAYIAILYFVLNFMKPILIIVIICKYMFLPACKMIFKEHKNDDN